MACPVQNFSVKPSLQNFSVKPCDVTITKALYFKTCIRWYVLDKGTNKWEHHPVAKVMEILGESLQIKFVSFYV